MSSVQKCTSPASSVECSSGLTERCCSVCSPGLLNRLTTHLYAAFALRVCLILYGDLQDAKMRLKYTDVDYVVYTDAARHVWNGDSPYDRPTYRYTPFLAWMLLPNITLNPLFGKFLFSGFDILAGRLIYSHVHHALGRLTTDVHHVETWARRCAYTWLYNPIVVAVSTRGNADTVTVTLVLLILVLYQERVFFLTGLFLGAAVHFKLYPVLFCLPLYLSLLPDASLLSFDLLRLNSARLRLVVGTFLALGGTTYLCYWIYGWNFLEETFLYHLSRRDTRHNFSVYFYMLYLTTEDDDLGIGILTFLPQVILSLALTVQFGRKSDDLAFCMFAQTFAFVTYNKVVTSQYFVWYLSLLPLVMPHLGLTKGEALTAVLLWGFTQASWLLPAYFLEFKGYNTFQFIWIESLAFYSANIGLLSKFIRKYKQHQMMLVKNELIMARRVKKWD